MKCGSAGICGAAGAAPAMSNASHLQDTLALQSWLEPTRNLHVGCRYDLYLGRRQFAEIDGPLLAWEFVLRDENGGMHLHCQ